MDDLVIVDCQYDFIDGTLACGHSHEAVAELVRFINSHPVRCLYTSAQPIQWFFQGEWRHLACSLCGRHERGRT